MRSRSSRSTGRSTERGRPGSRVDVYLLPAVVGGGLGDIEEVLATGRWLAGAGFPVYLYRAPGRPLPRSVEGPWAVPPWRRRRRLPAHGPGAMTVAPSWGVSAGPDRPGRLGRGGAWAAEAASIERAYGPHRTIHVSLEEFARTLSSARENRERLREGGVTARELPERLRRSERAGEVAAFRAAFHRFRAFDRPNVIHLFATFRPDRGFAREFPAAVQVGPLWPGHRRATAPSPPRLRRREWVWYASPSSAERLLPRVLEGLRGNDPPVALFVRTPRPWPSARPSPRVSIVTEPVPARAWRRRFAEADVRIVTGSRTLLEAIEDGGRFLYFNGVLGEGTGVRRHRPEKLRALLALGRRTGLSADVRRDLSDFARARRVAAVVRRVARSEGGWDRFAVRADPDAFPPRFRSAEALIRSLARALVRPDADSFAIVEAVRRASQHSLSPERPPRRDAAR